MQPNDLERHLIDRWQRELPLVPRPFREMADQAGVSEADVIGALTRLAGLGVLSRVGVTVRPNTAGASTLAALSAPPDRLEEVARIVNAEPGVNHNYEREHVLNLWFVVTGRDRDAVDATLQRLERASGLAILDLPLEKAYVVDLGFPVAWSSGGAPTGSSAASARGVASARRRDDGVVLRAVSDAERCVLEAIGTGLQLVSRPYAALAERAGATENEVIEHLRTLAGDGIISRLGLIVHHRALGYGANGMAVWDFDDSEVDRIGALFAGKSFVSLCYRRPRRPPRWPYNLFCMLHGREREAVLGHIEDLARIAGSAVRSRDVLFSRRCFKQRGANLAAA